MITPQIYAWKGAKWIGKIEFRDMTNSVFGKNVDTLTQLSQGLMIDIPNHPHINLPPKRRKSL